MMTYVVAAILAAIGVGLGILSFIIFRKPRVVFTLDLSVPPGASPFCRTTYPLYIKVIWGGGFALASLAFLGIALFVAFAQR